jgi:hypothetical protein
VSVRLIYGGRDGMGWEMGRRLNSMIVQRDAVIMVPNA